MISTVQDFEEATAFELYLFDTFLSSADEHNSHSIDLRDPQGKVTVTTSASACLSAEEVTKLKNKLTPLLFGAAWKVLDLFLELALNRAGLNPTGSRWRIEKKQQHALNGYVDPTILDCSPSVWKALLNIYSRTVEHRHCLIHRTAKVDTCSGTLEGVDKNGQKLNPLTLDQQLSLAKVSDLVARRVLQGGMDPRSEDHLKYQLDILSSHSCMPMFGVKYSSVPVEILLTLVENNGAFVLDLTDVIDRASMRAPSVTHFNLLIDIPDKSGRRLFALAEQCPIEKQITIDLKAPPAWLQFR